MKNPPAVKQGDRVRIVLEGNVRAVFANQGAGNVLEVGEAWSNSIHPYASHVISVETLKPLVKAGDVINPETLLSADWKVGSVIAEDSGPWHYINTGHHRWYSAEERETVDAKDMVGTDGSYRCTVIHVPTP